MPKVAIKQGERVIEVDLDERTTKQVVEALQSHTEKNLTDPHNNTIYPGETSVAEQIKKLREALLDKTV